MITNLYFVRHAHSTYTPDELGRPLSECGFSDAKIVTELLKNEGIDVVLSSPYKRAIQTVEGIAKHIGKEISIEEDFKERVLSKTPVEDFTYAITKVWEDFKFSWEGGESSALAQKRGVEATQKVLKEYEGKNIAIGTHGNIMALTMNFFNENYDFSFWNELAMPDIYKLSFDGGVLKEVSRVWKELPV